MEANMQILEGAQYRLRVKLTDEAGAQLPPEHFRVYAGAFCPGYAPVHFHAERTADEWVLTMPGLKPGRVPWNWQLLAAEYATGVEWLLAAGEVTVTPRHATGSGFVDPGELKITATLDKTTLQMTVTLGDSTSACALAAVAARQCAAAADTSAKAAADSAAAADTSAKAAADSAAAADTRAKAAADSAAAADTSAKAAADSAAAADTSAKAAADSAAVADTRAKAAADSAEAAASVGEQVKFDLFPLVLDWLRERFDVLLGEGNFSVIHEENKLTVAVSLATTAGQIDEVQQLLGRVVPQNIVTEMQWSDGLPLSYTRLEYLEGNPNTQINIPYETNADTGLAAEYMPLGNKISKSVLEASEASILSMFVPYPAASYGHDSWLFRYGRFDYGVAPGYTELEYVTGSVNYLNSQKGTTVLNGNTKTYSPNSIAFDGFATNLQVMRDFYRLRWAKVSQGDQVVMHLIPALDPAERPCLYDLMSKQAYYNSGSGKLSCSASEEYTPVEYIETTGGQYTRAAIVPRDNIGCRTSFSVSQQMNYPIICAYEGAEYAYYLLAAANVDPGYSYIRWGADGSANSRAWYNVGEEAVQELNWFNSKVVKGNGAQIYSLSSDTSFSLRRDLYLFAHNENGKASPVGGGARLYSVEFSEYATVVRHFVPALDSTGAPCFIETLSGVPFYNLGTGDFLYPGQETEATTYSLRRPQTFAQVTANGIRRLYHVPAGYNGTKEEYAMEYGFKPLVETPQPEEGYWKPEWKETEEEIVLEWVESEPPAEAEDLM